MGGARDASMTKVVLGGVAGLVLGQLILWWLPEPYRTDPLGLGPKLPEPVAFLAPDSIRGIVAFREPTEAPSSDGTETPGETALAAETQPESPAIDPPSTPGDQADEEIVLGLADAPRLAMPELRQKLSIAMRRDDMLSIESNWTDDKLKLWYLGLCNLAYCVTFADMSEPEIGTYADTTREFLSRVAGDRRRVVQIAEAAEAAYIAADQHREGILVAGRVESVSIAGQLFQTGLKANGLGSTIYVVSRVDPQAGGAYQLGDRVLIAGVLVTDPALHLLGYRGDADAVVLGGLPIKIPN